MNLTAKDISKVLGQYHIDAEINGFSFCINGYDEQAHEAKFIVKVDLFSHEPVIVKFIRQNRNPRHVIEEQSRFSEQLRKHGILTAKRYKCGGVYCSVYPCNGLDLDVTVEDYMGAEIERIDHELAYKIGDLMARNHHIAAENNLHINAGTLFNVTGYNEVSGYPAFIKWGTDGLIDKNIFNAICSVYDERFGRIQAVWDSLPKYATQGDYSTNNLTYIGEDLGIFDYNNAGDETLAGDMILEGLLIAYEHDLAEGLTDNDRLGLFKSFASGYLNRRPFSEAEKRVADDIYALSRGLWFTRIMYGDDALEKSMDDSGKTPKILREIYDDLTGRFFI
jgi:Ser/Thr protein kinase RdoA (MazF antagonist)